MINRQTICRIVVAAAARENNIGSVWGDPKNLEAVVVGSIESSFLVGQAMITRSP